MMDEFDEEALPPPRGFSRWLPSCVVSCAVIGFCALAWYAYHASAPAVKEEDLLVVEADKTPIKEKPLDPGGMKIPHQDKTVFDTFSGNAPPAKTEHVLPAPEEPMQPEADTSEPQTWINENLHKKPEEAPGAGSEQMIGAEEKKAPIAPPPDMAAPVAPTVKPQTALASPPLEQAVTVSEAPVAVKPEPITLQPAPATPVPASVPKPASQPVVKAHGSAHAQLGAYRSEADAKSDWAKMQKKYALLSGHQPAIVRADLGAKGVYFRLRVTGFADSAEVKAFCATLTAQGQACVLPAG